MAHTEQGRRLVDRPGNRPDVGAPRPAGRERGGRALADHLGYARNLVCDGGEGKPRHGHRDTALGAELREHEEEHDDHEGDPRAARPGGDYRDRRHERNRRAEDASTAVHRLVEPEEDRHRQHGREMLGVLVLEHGRPRPRSHEGLDPDHGGRRRRDAVDPENRSDRRRSMDHEVGH